MNKPLLTIGDLVSLVCVVAGVWLLWPVDGLPSVIPSQEATRVTYVYEKDKGGVPPAVLGAMVEINREGKVSAAVIDKDVIDSSMQTPPQYKIAVDAAKTTGLPSLVVQAGDSVIETVKAPTTAEQVREAIQ